MFTYWVYKASECGYQKNLTKLQYSRAITILGFSHNHKKVKCGVDRREKEKGEGGDALEMLGWGGRGGPLFARNKQSDAGEKTGRILHCH